MIEKKLDRVNCNKTRQDRKKRNKYRSLLMNEAHSLEIQFELDSRKFSQPRSKPNP